MNASPEQLGTSALSSPALLPAASVEVNPAIRHVPGTGLKFGRNNSFQAELRKRVDAYFESTGLSRRDVPAMFRKSAVLFTILFGSYLTLLLVHMPWYGVVPVAILLGLSMAGIGFNVQHDGGHQAYSAKNWLNKIMASSLDLIGGSSYCWHYKHGVFHHTYVNITHEDTDIDLGALGRLSPHQKRYWFHRFQHFYIWPLYGLFVIKWHFWDDFQNVIMGKLGEHKLPRPKGWDLVQFIVGKAVFLFLALGLPMILGFKPLLVVGTYLLVACTLGCVLSVVFQLAHAVEHAEFPMPSGDTGEMENAWAVHQVQTTVDFSRKSAFATWYMGGLNYQIEHHLMPRICHIHFPALSAIAEQTCKDFGVQFNEHKTFWDGIVSHYRWLREMGKPNSEHSHAH